MLVHLDVSEELNLYLRPKEGSHGFHFIYLLLVSLVISKCVMRVRVGKTLSSSTDFKSNMALKEIITYCRQHGLLL